MDNKFVQIIKNKWLRSVTLTLVLVAIIICAYLAINFAIEKANIADLDLTKEKLYSISQETKDKLRNLDTDITISLYNMYSSVEDIVNQYARLNEHIKVEKVENLLSKTQWKTDYGITDTDEFLVISTKDREKMLQSYELATMDYSTYQQIDVTEEKVTNAILDVTTKVKPKIYFLTGHNMYADAYFQYLQNAFTEEANEVEQLNLITAGKVPDDCKILIITALKEDIKEMERDRIIDYIKKGGEILLLLDPNLENVKLTNFQKVLDEYGVSNSNGVILEGDSNKMVSGASNFVIATINNNSSITKNMTMDLNVCFINSGRLTIASEEELEKKNVTAEILATVSDKAFYRTDLQNTSQTKISSDESASGDTIGAMLTKKIDENTSSKLIVFANTAFATNLQIPITQTYAYYALDFSNNKDVILNAVSYLTEREDNITIRKNIEAVNYEVTEAQNKIILTVIFTIPVLIVVIGIVVWVLRRRKK